MHNGWKDDIELDRCDLEIVWI